MTKALALSCALEPETVADMLATLRHLKRQYEIRGEVDAILMEHVDKTLALVARDCANSHHTPPHTEDQ